MGAPSNNPGTGPEMMDTLPTVTELEVTPGAAKLSAGVTGAGGAQVEADAAAADEPPSAALLPATNVPATRAPPRSPRAVWPIRPRQFRCCNGVIPTSFPFSPVTSE